MNEALKTVFHYSEPSFRKAHLPWVALAFLVSLIFEIIFLWQVVVLPPRTIVTDETARSAWLSAWVVLLVINEGMFKGGSLSWYFSRRKLYQGCSLMVKPNEVCLQSVLSRMSRQKVLLALEGSSLAEDGKTEYLLRATYQVRRVRTVKKRWNGSLVIHGEIDCQLHDETYSSFYGGNEDGYITRRLQHCVIPPIFDEMEWIAKSLRAMIS